MISTALLVSVLMAEAAATTPVTPVLPSKNDRVVCRTYEVTGSLAGTKKVCHTVKQWDDASRAAREAGEKMQDAGRTVHLDPLSGG